MKSWRLFWGQNSPTHPVCNLGLHVVCDKLVLEPGVLAPEAPDVRHLVQHHGEPLNADAEGPAGFALDTRVVNQLLTRVHYNSSLAGEGSDLNLWQIC